MEIGTPGGRPSMLESNRRFRDLLRGRGVEVHYSEFNGDHTESELARVVRGGNGGLIRKASLILISFLISSNH